MNPQDMVREFHEKFGVPVAEKPGFPDDRVRALRHDLIDEELQELVEADNADDLVGVADAIGDLLYVTYGMALAYGIDMEPVLREIHASNMTKTGGGTRSDGKILKGPNFKLPDLAVVLKEQGADI